MLPTRSTDEWQPAENYVVRLAGIESATCQYILSCPERNSVCSQKPRVWHSPFSEPKTGRLPDRRPSPETQERTLTPSPSTAPRRRVECSRTSPVELHEIAHDTHSCGCSFFNGYLIIFLASPA